MTDHRAEYDAAQSRALADNLRNRVERLEQQEATWLRRIQEANTAVDQATLAVMEWRARRDMAETRAAEAEGAIDLEAAKRAVMEKARADALAERHRLLIACVERIAKPGAMIVPVTLRKIAQAALEADAKWEPQGEPK